MERMVVEYLANAFWQLPVLALGAWLLLRMWRPGPAAQHRIWLAVLALGLLLPLRGMVPGATVNATEEAPFLPAVASRQAAVSLPSAQNGASTALVADKTPDSAQGQDQDQVQSTGNSWLGVIAAAFSESVHRVSVSAALAQWIVGLWLAVALWGLLRIVLAWQAARQLVANSREAVLDERQQAALRECARSVGVAVPEIRESGSVAGPVIVGAANPVLLWPENFVRTSDDEMRAALCHELAHVRRRDYGMNLLCEMAALPLKWHPATHRVERRIRATREMACDAMAAKVMDSETLYAECLVRLARSIVGHGAVEDSMAAALFNGNVMEERVMRLMRGRTAISLRVKVARGAAGATAMLATAAVAAAFHFTPAMAQDIPSMPPAPVQVTPAAPPAAPIQVNVPAVPAAAPAPVELSAPVALAPAEPVALAPAVSPAMKIAVPLAPAISTGVPVPLAPMAAPQVPTPVTPAVPQHDSKPVVIIDGHLRDLTPAERAQIEKQLADAQKRIAEATAKIDSPEFRKQMQDAQAKALRAQTMLNSAEFQKQMADARKQIAEATAKINSPEFRQKIQAEIDAAAKVNSAEFQKQIGDAQAAALRAQTMINSAEFRKQMADAQKQIAEATAQFNSPEFRKQIEDATRAAAKVNSAEFQKQMADAQKQIAGALAKMKADQKKGAAK